MDQGKKLAFLSFACSVSFATTGALLVWAGYALGGFIHNGRLLQQLNRRAKNNHRATPEMALRAFSQKNNLIQRQLFWNIQESKTEITGNGIFEGKIESNYPILSCSSGLSLSKPLIYQKTISGTIFERGVTDPHPMVFDVSVAEKHSPYFQLKQPENQKVFPKNSSPSILVMRNPNLSAGDEIVEVIEEKFIVAKPNRFTRAARFFSQFFSFIRNFGVLAGTSEKEVGIQVGSLGLVYGSFVFNKASKSIVINRPEIIASKIENIANPAIEKLAQYTQHLILAGILASFSFMMFSIFYHELRVNYNRGQMAKPVPLVIIETKNSLTCLCNKAPKNILAEACGHLISCETCQENFHNICPICQTKTHFMKIYVTDI